MNDKASAVAGQFLDRFFRDTSFDINLRAVKIGQSNASSIFTRSSIELDEFVEQHTECELYFGCATREGGGKKEHCREAVALWCDVDFKNVQEAEARERLARFQPAPSIIINSGGGLHVYWLLLKVAVAFDLERVLKGLAKVLSADPQCAEIARVLRIPGSFNHKYRPSREVRIEQACWERRYPLERFIQFELLAPYPGEAIPSEGKIPPESQHHTLLSFAGTLRNKGLDEAAIFACLKTFNDQRCDPPAEESKLHEIAHAIAKTYAPGHANGNGRPVTTSLPILEDEEEPQASAIPVCPLGVIEGDFIGDLVHELTDGTAIPSIFLRENIKVILGAVINGRIGLRSHPNIHTREYHILVSPNPQACKRESWERTGGRSRGFLHDFLRNGELAAGLVMSPGIALLDGGLFGSGEFMAAVLARPENKRSIAYFDEMSEVFEKDKVAGSIIEKKLLQLFEGESITQGSFKNGVHVADGIEFSLVGCFTVPSFLTSFTGRGSAGSGYLSRCTFSYSDRVPYAGDWAEINSERVMDLLAKIASCAALVQAHSKSNPYIVEETPEATRLRRETAEWIEKLDDRYKARLADHMKRDLILRAICSENPVIDADKVRRAKLWVENQHTNRFLLWPEDAGSNVERMEQTILRTLEKAGKPLSDSRLGIACNVDRLGSGGYMALHAAIVALTRGAKIKTVGKTRKGRSVYDLIR